MEVKKLLKFFVSVVISVFVYYFFFNYIFTNILCYRKKCCCCCCSFFYYLKKTSIDFLFSVLLMITVINLFQGYIPVDFSFIIFVNSIFSSVSNLTDWLLTLFFKCFFFFFSTKLINLMFS